MRVFLAVLVLVSSCVAPHPVGDQRVEEKPSVGSSAVVLIDGGSTIARAAPIAAANVAEDWPFRCSALKVYNVISSTNVTGYHMPVRCVPELSTYPGSVLADKSCVPGCVDAGRRACWSVSCAITVTDIPTEDKKP